VAFKADAGKHRG